MKSFTIWYKSGKVNVPLKAFSSTLTDSWGFTFLTCHCIQEAFAFNYFGRKERRRNRRRKRKREEEAKEKGRMPKGEKLSISLLKAHFLIVNVACFTPTHSSLQGAPWRSPFCFSSFPTERTGRECYQALGWNIKRTIHPPKKQLAIYCCQS